MPDDHISIGPQFGFGFAVPRLVETDADGFQVITYYYLPWSLQYGDQTQMVAALNRLGEERIPVDKRFPNDIQGEPELTPKGVQALQTFPLYGRLLVKAPHIIWEAHMPEGGIFQSIRTNNPDILFDEALKTFPQNLWAKRFFAESVPHAVPPGEDGSPVAMHMQPPLDGPLPDDTNDSDKLPENQGWNRNMDVPRANTAERIEPPIGLFKRLWVSLYNDKVEQARAWVTGSPDGAIVEGAVCVLQTPDQPIEWEPHTLARLDAPARLAPRFLKYFVESRMARDPEDCPWAAFHADPCYGARPPVVMVADHPEAPFYASAVLFEPLETIDRDALSRTVAILRS